MVTELDRLMISKEARTILQLLIRLEHVLRQHLFSDHDTLFHAVMAFCESETAQVAERTMALDQARAQQVMAEVGESVAVGNT